MSEVKKIATREDIALMRTIPGMVVINPSDDIEARAAVRAAYEYVGPVYMRFGRLAVPVINDRPDYKFELGKGVVLREGKVVTVEEHSVIGGLGSAVCDVLSANVPTKVLKIGINDVYGESGPALELIEKYGLGINGIYEKVKAFVS